VTITVADNGIGIAPEHRNEVFKVFTRLNLDDSSPGSGVGLATCAKVVHQLGGRIWVDDGLDGGVAMRVWLPDVQDA
jgi:signal transduction histidine kinase